MGLEIRVRSRAPTGSSRTERRRVTASAGIASDSTYHKAMEQCAQQRARSAEHVPAFLKEMFDDYDGTDSYDLNTA